MTLVIIIGCDCTLAQSDLTSDLLVISLQRDSTSASTGRRFGCSGVDLIAGTTDAIPVGTCRGIHATFRMIVAEAFNVSANEPFLTGGPSWLDVDTYSVSLVARDPRVTYTQLQALVKALLVRRFALEFHWSQRSRIGYELHAGSLSDNVVKDGPNPLHPGTVSNEQHSLIFRRFTMAMLAEFLSVGLRMPVVDKTGLTDPYTFTITVQAKQPTAPGVRDVSGPTIFLSLRQLGLRMTPAPVRIETLVVDRLKRPRGF